METAEKHPLIDDILSNIGAERLQRIAKTRKANRRVGEFEDALRDALQQCAIGCFNGAPYVFTGKIYEEMSWATFNDFIYKVLKRSGLPYEDYMRHDHIERTCRAAVQAKELKLDNSILVMRNGVYDFKTNTLNKFDAKFIQISSVNYDYDEREYTFMWRQFLNEVLPNKKAQMVLQEFLGAIFINRQEVKLEAMLVLLGSGANGKSVIFDTVLGLLGRENVTTFGFDALIKDKDRKLNVATINGKRLNYSSEMRCLQIDEKNADAIKTIISGEQMEARQLYCDNFMAHNIPLMMMNANKMPRLRDPSEAIRRRILIIPFEVSIPPQKQNRELSKHLEVEYSAIFNWIIEGRKRLIRHKYKFTQCSEIDEAIDDYQSMSNSVLHFMHDKQFAPNYDAAIDAHIEYVVGKTLYSNYVTWCAENEYEPEDNKKFGHILTQAGYHKSRTAKGTQYGIYALRKAVAHYKRISDSKEEIWKENCSKIVRWEGKNCVKGIQGLASVMHISEARATELFREGLFDGCYSMQGRSKMFAVRECSLKLIQAGVKREPNIV